MADLSLSPAPSAAAPVAAPAPAASRPAAAPLKAETADPGEAKDEPGTPTRADPTLPRVTVAVAASSSESLGGLAGFLPGGNDEASSAISTGRAFQPLPTVTQVGAVPTDTGSPFGISDAAENCPSSDISCRWGLGKTVGVSFGGIRESSSAMLYFH